MYSTLIFPTCTSQVNLCLAGDAVMTYIRDKPSSSSSSSQREIPEGRVRVLLPRLALQIQSGTVRYDYRHSIANTDLLSDRRVSITFRANAHPFHNVS